LSEETMIEAISFGHDAIREICRMQNELRELAGVAKVEFAPPVRDEALRARVKDRFAEPMRAALLTAGKLARSAAVSQVCRQAVEALVPGEVKDAVKIAEVKRAIHDLERDTVRAVILEGGRVDGRTSTDIRPITGEVGLLPRSHGSALFTRGETQAIVTCTLGTTSDEQIIDGLQDEVRKRFMLHYNFPPFCVREVKPIRGPGRREIGHGALAERAIEAVLPEHDAFPYTIRVVSDILESNGSSSMATVCGTTLALMDAGVKIRRPVAGIAMGLVAEGDRFQVVSDILGTEDHCGDMDFKVAGTQNGITALQMDIKMTGVPRDVMAKALDQARIGRLSILRSMLKTLSRPRDEISKYAPKTFRVTIPKDKIGMLIGPGGKNIRRIQEETSSTVDVQDDGTVTIFSTSTEGAEAARAEIELLGREAKVGDVYKGRVISIKDFGCFLELWAGTEALCHISELSDEYLARVEDAVNMGDELEVKVISIDDAGRVKVSRRAAMMGADYDPEKDPRRSSGGAPREGGREGGRGGDRGRGGRDGDRGRGGRGGDRRGPRDGDRGGRR
jgi:polyribonucleotide nucleotidyltransferase